MYDIPPLNPQWNLSVLPKRTPFQSSETHVSFAVQNAVGNKRKVIESKSEAEEVENVVGSKRKVIKSKSEVAEVTLTTVIGNRNAEKKVFKLCLNK